jgi:hypothetical protein
VTARDVDAFVARALIDEPWLDEAELRAAIAEMSKRLVNMWDVTEDEDYRAEGETSLGGVV